MILLNTVTVILAPDAPIVQVSASKTTVTEGQDSLQLTCEVRIDCILLFIDLRQNYHMAIFEVDANPPATIEWIKNLNTDQEEVIGGLIVRMLTVNTFCLCPGTGSTIRISTVRRGNAGTYNCVATNSVGTSIP